MILTDGARMLRTPTYYVYRMYVPFQDATFLPVSLDAGTWSEGSITLPRVDAIAARGRDGRIWLALTNIDPEHAVRVEAAVNGVQVRSASGETLTAPRVDSINTFDAPDAVVPRPLAATVTAGRIAVELPASSVSVIALQP
jgi:alpha-N-arabinofuranosidase